MIENVNYREFLSFLKEDYLVNQAEIDFINLSDNDEELDDSTLIVTIKNIYATLGDQIKDDQDLGLRIEKYKLDLDLVKEAWNNR